MQHLQNAASAAATHATALAQQAASLIPTTHTHIGTHQDSHTETLPEGAIASEIKNVDEEGLSVFEGEKVKHEVLVKINQLAIEDVRHGLQEVSSLNLSVEGGEKKGIAFYHPKRYFTVTRPQGVDYIGEIEVEAGKAIHVRAHKASAHAHATFHSIDTRPSSEGGAVFKTGEPLHWFDY